VVGFAAALRQPGRLYGAGALLLFPSGAAGLRCAELGDSGRSGVYGGVYTCIGVAHAMQGPRQKWRPRIVLLTAAFGVAAAAHIAALPVERCSVWQPCFGLPRGAEARCCRWCLRPWPGPRAGFVCYGFSPDAFSYVFRSAAGFMWVSLDPARRFFSTMANAGVTVAAAAAAVLYLGLRKSRYFGNTAPLLCALVLLVLVLTGAPGSPWLWALPFLLTFVGGVFADAYEGPRGRLAVAAAGQSCCCRRCSAC